LGGRIAVFRATATELTASARRAIFCCIKKRRHRLFLSAAADAIAPTIRSVVLLRNVSAMHPAIASIAEEIADAARWHRFCCLHGDGGHQTGTTMSGDFEPEQKRYLEGFVAGLQIAKNARGGAATPAGAVAAEPIGPDAAGLRAQDRVLKSGGKLSDPEKFKRELNPFDAYEKLKAQAVNNEAPKPDDNFRWRFFGLFYCAPTQKAYMCRLRIPNGILTHWQFAGLADIAERYAGGYSHVTTRANLQMREVEPKNAVAMVEAIQDLGLGSRGSGADNIRNVTGTPTAGIDPQELLDTRPYAREWHYHILNDRSLYGLPRKFNVGFDGGGTIAVLEDTNDIGFQAVEVKDGFGVEPGIYFRLMLGGITGHQDFARDTGIIVKPAEATAVADAVVRVFIDNGNRSDRAKARLKYVLDAWGFDKFIAAMEEKLCRKLQRISTEAIAPRPLFDRLAHIGAHPQKQEGLCWLGVVLPVGKITAVQMRGIAKIAAEFGDGEIRLTVWQNFLLSGIPAARIAEAEAAIEATGLSTKATSIRAGLVACTGNAGCKLANSNTKQHAEDIAQWCEAHVALDSPINIHLTGCPNSCAQHYIGDIGLVGTKVQVSDDGDQVEGYHVVVGGGYGPDAACGREIYRDMKADEAPKAVERMLKAYLAHRASAEETFMTFTRRHEIEALKSLCEQQAVE
jgi:ferredoxin-nitrite reductase